MKYQSSTGEKHEVKNMTELLALALKYFLRAPKGKIVTLEPIKEENG